MPRHETRVRARALQLLYAWEVQGRPALASVTAPVLQRYGGRGTAWEDAEILAGRIAADADALDQVVAGDLEHWRLPRVGVVERNILRLAAHELREGVLPAPVVISEAVRLAHWFAGAKAAPFVNGVLDALARRLGRL